MSGACIAEYTARVVVTGAAGRLGGKIAAALRATGRHVIAIDRAPEPSGPAPRAWDEYVQCDLAGAYKGDARTALVEAVEGADAVVHCAAWPGPSATPPPAVSLELGTQAARSIGLETIAPGRILRDNLAMTHALCDIAVEARVRRFVFSSTAFAMGWSHATSGPQALTPKYLPMDEAHPPQPTETYGLSKLLCEEALAAAARTASSSSFVSLRFTNVIKSENWAKLPWPAPTAEQPLPLVFWAYAHEDDVVDAHVSAVLRAECAESGTHESYLIAAADTRFAAPTRELLSTCAGLSLGTEGGVAERHPYSGNESVLCCRKARDRLGWNPRSWQVQPPSKEQAASFQSAPVASESLLKAALALSLLPRAERRGGLAAVLASTDAEVRALSLEGFVLDCGLTLPEGAFVTYKLHGDLASLASLPGGPADTHGTGRKGLILHPTSFDAVHSELEYRIGSGKTLNTDLYNVLVVNMLGNGVSLSPSNAPASLQGNAFPSFSVRDNVRAQAAVLRSLGVDLAAKPLDLIFGYSMGGLQAYEWAVRFPAAAKAIAVVCGAARCSPVNQAFLLSLQGALCADSRWNPARQMFDAFPADGLRALARVYSGWGVGEAFYEQRLFASPQHGHRTDATVAGFVKESYEVAFLNSDADDLLCMASTWQSAEVSDTAGGDLAAALSRVEARVLLMPCASDRYFSLDAARHEAKLLGRRAVLRPIESAVGHRAGDPWRRGLEGEDSFIREQVHALLAGTL